MCLGPISKYALKTLNYSQSLKVIFTSILFFMQWDWWETELYVNIWQNLIIKWAFVSWLWGRPLVNEAHHMELIFQSDIGFTEEAEWISALTLFFIIKPGIGAYHPNVPTHHQGNPRFAAQVGCAMNPSASHRPFSNESKGCSAESPLQVVHGAPKWALESGPLKGESRGRRTLTAPLEASFRDETTVMSALQ